GQARARREADRSAAAATAERNRVRRLLFVATMNLASTAHAEQRSARLRELLAEARPAPGEEDNRGFEWHYLNRLVEAEPVLLDPGDAPAAPILPAFGKPSENYRPLAVRGRRASARNPSQARQSLGSTTWATCEPPGTRGPRHPNRKGRPAARPERLAGPGDLVRLGGLWRRAIDRLLRPRDRLVD